MKAKGEHFSGAQRDLFGGEQSIQAPPSRTEANKRIPAPLPVNKNVTESMTPNSAEEFHNILHRLIGDSLRLVVTQNRISLISFRRISGAVVVRLHQAFLDAPIVLIEDLARWIKSPRNGAPESIRLFSRGISHPPAVVQSRNCYTRTEANVHDLEILFDKVNQTFFGGRIDVKITYGRDSSRLKVRTRRLGSYTRERRLITIHPLLDNPRVPEFVIAFTIYHEMLHALQPVGHKRPHDVAFRKAEKEHPEYDKVMIWRKKNEKFLRGKVNN